MRHRAAELANLEHELGETRKRARRKIRELDAQAVGAFAPAARAPAAPAALPEPQP